MSRPEVSTLIQGSRGGDRSLFLSLSLSNNIKWNRCWGRSSKILKTQWPHVYIHTRPEPTSQEKVYSSIHHPPSDRTEILIHTHEVCKVVKLRNRKLDGRGEELGKGRGWEVNVQGRGIPILPDASDLQMDVETEGSITNVQRLKQGWPCKLNAPESMSEKTE